jgi:3-methyladenine DNA glycosylase AlkD
MPGPRRAPRTESPARADRPLVHDLRATLAAVADPARAPAMQRYMKSAIPFLGVPTPLLRASCRAVFARHPLAGFEAWRDTALALWRGATHREHRYAAIELTGERRYRDLQTVRALAMYEEMIVTGAWWDYVDPIASHRLAAILRREPTRMRRTMLAWARSPDLWKRRSAILCQLGFQGETDLDLLYGAIEPSLGSGEFFLRKAIGWALRQHAWTDPDEVVRWVRANESRLSPLSRREALKNVTRPGRRASAPGRRRSGGA